MEKSTEKLLKKMNEDKEFAEKLLSQTENEKVIELAEREGIDITLDNIIEINEIIKEAMGNFHDGELSEEELENVSGGGFLLGLAVGLAIPVSGGAILTFATAAATASATASAMISAAASGALLMETKYKK